jgi:hypothetical protein
MPAFNEAATIVGVLDDLIDRVDRVVIVNDGSTDDTGPIVDRWAANQPKATVIHFPENRGLSAALRAGWNRVGDMLAAGELRPDDVAFSIDADGQHEPAAIDGMIDHLVENDCDCVIGMRDLGYHGRYKRIGNHVMTLIARACGGFRFEDVESGYRVFRIGPLLEAQQYYEGYKYSETVEVAVILARLGYKVCNSYPVAIPVARTRTRLSDAAIDAICMPLAWYRLACVRNVPRQYWPTTLMWAAPAVLVATAVALLATLAHPFYLGDDSAQSYAHVWYISQTVFEHHHLTLRMSVLEDGKALLFPYAFIPWVGAAIVYPLLGDWGVTLVFVAGVVAMLFALRWFRPAFANPVLLALFLVNPLLWNGITQFQMPTFWAFALAFLGMGFFERKRPVVATSLLAAAVVAHPMMGAGAIAVYAAFEWIRTRTAPWRFVRVGAAALVVGSPAVVMLLSTPLVAEARPLIVAASTLDNVRRLSVLLLALLLPALGDRLWRYQHTVFGTGVAATAALMFLVPPSGLWQESSPQFAGYLQQAPVEQRVSYRVMVQNNREDGMVEFLKAKAVLSNEFFTESEHRQKFHSLDSYECMLATRHVGHVVMTKGYLKRYGGSELSRLAELEQAGRAQQEYSGPDGVVAYRVMPRSELAKGSLRECRL